MRSASALRDESGQRQTAAAERRRRRRHRHAVVVAGMAAIDADLPVLRSFDQAQLGARPVERAAPDTGPGQAAGQHDQHQPRDPEAGDAVQVLEQRPPAQREPRPEACRASRSGRGHHR